MLRKSSIFASLGVGLMLLAARTGLADTITVHSLTENPTTGVYTYNVEFDEVADVQAGDGFVIYDFPGEVSYSFSGGFTTSQWALETQNTSNDLEKNASVDATAAAAAAAQPMKIPFDNSSVPNLTFLYQGPFPGTGLVSGILTITTDVLGNDTASVYGSEDHSGPTKDIPFSFSANPVVVPSSAPAPAAAVGGIALMGLMALARIKKALHMA